MRIRHRDREPRVHGDAYVAPTATLIGNVEVAAHARVLSGAVLDAEGSRVTIGEYSIIGEHAVLRASAAGTVSTSAHVATWRRPLRWP